MNRKCRKMNYAFDKNFVVNNEKLVIETSAQLVLEEDKIEGVLVLTDKRLLFLDKNFVVEHEFNLTEIESISVFKLWNFFDKGISMIYDNRKFLIQVGYASDWIKLINTQLYIA